MKSGTQGRGKIRRLRLSNAKGTLEWTCSTASSVKITELFT